MKRHAGGRLLQGVDVAVAGGKKGASRRKQDVTIDASRRFKPVLRKAKSSESGKAHVGRETFPADILSADHDRVLRC